MPLTAYQQIRFYDPMLDCEAVRISGFSGRGEYWMKLPLDPSGRRRREQKEKALEAIEEAIASGCEPGEVIVE